MAKIDRYNGNLKAFGSAAIGTERTVFGGATQSDTLDANITADLLRGWAIIGVAANPTKQHFNGLAFTLGQLIAYLHQRGIAEWNTAQEYFDGSVVTTDVGIYRLKTGGSGTVDPDIDGGTNWEKAALTSDFGTAAAADLTTSQTDTTAGRVLKVGAGAGQIKAVGPVSVAGGLPTGAIIETGSNLNGRYIKYADGTMICNRSTSPSLAATVATGSLFYVTTDLTFPATFFGFDIVVAPTVAHINAVCFAGSPNITSTSTFTFILISATSGGQGFPGYIAIGRWF